MQTRAVRIRPAGHTHGSGKVDDDIGVSGGLADGDAVSLISRQPSIEMRFCG